MRYIGARHLQPDWFGTGGEQEFVEAELFAAAEHDATSGDIDRQRRCAEPQLNAVVDVKFGRAQRDPLLWRGARKVILRQVRTIVRRGSVIADDRHTAAIALTTQHFRSGVSGRAAADDYHVSWCSGGRARLCRHAPSRFRYLVTH